MSARRSSSATFCSARCNCRAAPRPRPGNGRPARGARRTRRAWATNCRRRFSNGARSSKLKSTYTDALPGYRQSDDASRAHELRAGLDHDRPAVVVRAEPAEHSGSHRGRPQDPPRLHRRRRATSSSPPIIRRSSCGCSPRSPASRRCARRFRDGLDIHAMTASEMFGVPVEGHAGRSAPPRQGDQFRHHLRHLGFRAGQPARHRARGGRRLYQEIFRALSRHPRLHGRDQGLREEERLCRDAVRPQMPLPRYRRIECLRSAPSTSAPRSMRGCKAPPPTSSAAP